MTSSVYPLAAISGNLNSIAVDANQLKRNATLEICIFFSFQDPLTALPLVLKRGQLGIGTSSFAYASFAYVPKSPISSFFVC